MKVDVTFRKSGTGTVEHSADGVNYTPIQPGSQVLTTQGTHHYRVTSVSGIEVQDSITLYEVTFDPTGTPTDRQLIAANGTIQKPADPLRDGYTFLNWQCGGTAWDFTTPVTEDVHLVSQWRMEPPELQPSVTYGREITAPAAYTGADLVFSVAPSHPGPDTGFAYQWQCLDDQELWQDLPGADQPEYVLTKTDVGTYAFRCLVTCTDTGGLSAQQSVELSAVIEKAVVKRPPADTTHYIHNYLHQTYQIPASPLYTVLNNVQKDTSKYQVLVCLNDKVNYRWDETGLPGSLTLEQRMDYTEDLVYTFTIHSDWEEPAPKPHRTTSTPAVPEAEEPFPYNITFDGLEDAAAAELLSAIQILSGGSLILPEPAGLSRPGYQFAGWVYNGEVCPAGSRLMPTEEALTLTILWEPVPMSDAQPDSQPQQTPPAQEAPEQTAPGKPFVILNAVLFLLNLLLTLLAWKKAGRRIPCIGLTLAVLVLTVCTDGLSGLALADGWTILIAACTCLCAWLSLKTA